MVDLLIPTSGYRELTIEEILRRKAEIDARAPAVAKEFSVAKRAVKRTPGAVTIDPKTGRFVLMSDENGNHVYTEVGTYSKWADGLTAMMSAPEFYHGYWKASKQLREEIDDQLVSWGIVVDTHIRYRSEDEVYIRHHDGTARLSPMPASVGTDLLELPDDNKGWDYVRKIFATFGGAPEIKQELHRMSGGLPVRFANLSYDISYDMSDDMQSRVLAFSIEPDLELVIHAVKPDDSQHYARTVRYG